MIMSHCTVPTWNPRHQRQEQVVETEDTNKFPHVQQNQINHFVPMSKCEEVAELTWENGHLESIVHQATRHGHHGQYQAIWGESLQQMAPVPPTVLAKKRMRAESDPQYGGNTVFSTKNEDHEECYTERSACASASATFCRDNDAATMVTWPSFDESSRSIRSKTTCDEDSACHDGASENKEDKHETKRSNSSRRNRAAAVHNQSERRRRDRINQKMKALQRLVPNANKTDKASILEEVINYLKQLQAQVQLMSSTTARNMATPQLMATPLGLMHQQIQMSIQLARMGMGVGLGMGMGMVDMTALARAATAAATAAATTPQAHSGLIHPTPMPTPTPNINPFMPPAAFAMAAPSPAIPSATQANSVARATTVSPATSSATTNSVPFTDPYSAFLPQTMEMEFFNNMAALYRQQGNQSTQTTSSKLN